MRSVVYAYFSAWHPEAERLVRKGKKVASLSTDRIRFTIVQLMLLAGIFLLFGSVVAVSFLGAALLAILLLETANYIEHYGMSRQPVDTDRNERILPRHSWNSDHMFGRMFLFELSRHSDHHYIANTEYQFLKHMDESPQMPTGFPGMMLLSLVPPLWFSIMNPRVTAWQKVA